MPKVSVSLLSFYRRACNAPRGADGIVPGITIMGSGPTENIHLTAPECNRQPGGNALVSRSG
jgi:hypothetical protein